MPAREQLDMRDINEGIQRLDWIMSASFKEWKTPNKKAVFFIRPWQSSHDLEHEVRGK